jgi:hypothetical protein
MRVWILFGQAAETYPGQYAPTALEILDEYTLDSWGIGLEAAQKSLENDKAPDLVGLKSWAWFEVNLGSVEQDLRNALLKIIAPIKGNLAVPGESHSPHPSHNSITVTAGRKGGKIADSEILE